MNKKGKKKLNLISKIYSKKNLEKIEGFDNAVIGLEVKTDRLIYSVKRCLKILKEKMSAEEAIDYFYMDVFSENAEENKVIFCEDYLIKKTDI
jgi:hypothetical protein